MGLSNIEVKKMNRNSVFRYMLKVGNASKNSIAEALHLSIPTIAQSLRELEERGFIREGVKLDSIGGRRAQSYQCVKDAKVALGMDITADYINMVMINLSKEIVLFKREEHRLCDDEKSYDKLRMIIMQFIEQSDIPVHRILGLGVSLPAIIDETGTKIYDLHEKVNLSYDLHGIIQNWFSFPVYLENDANSCGKAELRLQDSKKNVLYFFLSDTVGGAVMINGQVYYGKNRRGGEFGHMVLVPGGRPCYCGRLGCVDSYCCTKVLAKCANGNLEAFFAGLKEGNFEYQKIWEEYLDYLALAVHNLAIAFDSEIIIGGYLGQYIAPYLDGLWERVRRLDPYLTDPSFIRPAVLEYEASAVGVAAVFVEKFISTI